MVAKSELRIKFFELLFGDNKGYLCLATTDSLFPKTSFEEKFFAWPSENDLVENYIFKAEAKRNVYFCVNLLDKQIRKKGNCLPTNLVWADLDNINPTMIDSIPPPITIQSSPDRWQAIWRLSVKLDPVQAEDYSRRITYHIGADKSGWDLTQLLRVPFTKNFKYDPIADVILERASEITAPPLLFEALPANAEGVYDSTPSAAMPSLNGDGSELAAEKIIYKYSSLLQKSPFYSLYNQEPKQDEDWSSVLWRTLHECLRVGMTPEETFIVADKAKCNKYKRDGRPVEHLWRDVLKAASVYAQIEIETQLITMPVLVDKPTSNTFIDTYREWAVEATDAVPAFHDLSIFIVLSAIVSNSVKLETSAGPLTPNLWGLILGDSTLTRKTTAMRLALDFIIAMDPELLLATDGTPEGILSGLSERPNRASIFHKDEVSGLFDGMTKKDYLAGMMETLTALYDVPPIHTRRLRKETIVLESPSFVFLSGGVPDRIYASVTDSFVLSGFLPRFLVVSGFAAVEDRRPLGPPSDLGIAKRPMIMNRLADLYEHYAGEAEHKIGGQRVTMPIKVTAQLDKEAWSKYGEYESTMLNAGNQSLLRDLALPTFDRLSRSLLKMAVILGATRQRPKDNKITINVEDIENAAWYVQSWGQNSINLLTNAGKGQHEKFLDRVFTMIIEKPGVLKSDIMRRFHLDSKNVNAVMTTLEERALIRKEQRGRGAAYWAA